MANIEELNLSYQVFVDVMNLRRDMWSHTTGYLTQLQGNPGQAAVDILIGNARAVAAGAAQRTARVDTIINTPAALTALTNGLTGMNCTINSANTMFTALKNAVASFQTAVNAAVTGADLQTACNNFQTAVPSPISMW